MNRTANKFFAATVTAFALSASALTASANSGSDQALDQLMGNWAQRDSGSQRFDSYVERVNQEIAYRDATEAYGAAGPNGPLDGFNGYVTGFRSPDSGSQQFNNYVDAVNQVIQFMQGY